LLAETNVLTDQLALSEKQNGVNSIATLQLRAQVHERALAYNNVEHQILMTKAAAENATTQLDAQLAGNKALSDLTKNRLDFEMKIAQAKHEKRFDVAKELKDQQSKSELEIKAQQLMRTPQQVRADRREQEKHDRAIRHINAVERNNPNQIAADERNRVSKAAQLAREQFALRHAEPIMKDARKPIGDAKKRALPAAPPADKKVNEFKAQTLIVTQIKSQ
jgi:hypothetical protein